MFFIQTAIGLDWSINPGSHRNSIGIPWEFHGNSYVMSWSRSPPGRPSPIPAATTVFCPPDSWFMVRKEVCWPQFHQLHQRHRFIVGFQFGWSNMIMGQNLLPYDWNNLPLTSYYLSIKSCILITFSDPSFSFPPQLTSCRPSNQWRRPQCAPRGSRPRPGTKTSRAGHKGTMALMALMA